MENKKTGKDFGKKEFLLNYANRRWGLTKTNKVGEVMALIRECQPKSFQEWEKWYFEHAKTNTKEPLPVTRYLLNELGERLYEKLITLVIPEIKESIQTLTKQDCIDYIYQLTLCRTYDGYEREKSVVFDNLAKRFTDVIFEETNPCLDHSGDIDYIGRVGDKVFGLQIKPITANASLGNYDVSARMRQSFKNFEDAFGGKVFIIFSTEEHVRNEQVFKEIKEEIKRLKHIH